MTLLQISADVSVRIVSQPDRIRDWMDYVTLAAATLAALGTLSAVLVALFGPRWHARQRRPALYTQSIPRAIYTSAARVPKIPDKLPDQPRDWRGWPGGPQFTFELGNLSGRDTARDVEIFVSHARAITEHTAMAGAQRIPLVTAMSVPANFRRPVPLLLVGSDIVIHPPEGATRRPVSLDDTSPRRPPRLGTESYDITLFATGSNFDAVRFDGELLVTRTEASNDGIKIVVKWKEDLHQVPVDAPRRRPMATEDDHQKRRERDRRDDQQRANPS